MVPRGKQCHFYVSTCARHPSQSLPGRELRNAERRRAVSSFFNAVLRRSVVVSRGYWRSVLARFALTTVRGLRCLRITRNAGHFEFDAASNRPLATRSRWGLGESGLWQKHKVELVQSKPTPEITQ